MTATTIDITAGQAQELRARHAYDAGREVPDDFRTRAGGWQAVNRAYLSDARASSEVAMRDLMRAVGVERVTSIDQAADLIEMAVRVFAPPEGYSGRIERPQPGVLMISNKTCPMFRTLEERGWQGITACSSWHHRQGWYDALGVVVSDSVLREKKWGDVACVAELRIEGLVDQ